MHCKNGPHFQMGWVLSGGVQTSGNMELKHGHLETPDFLQWLFTPHPSHQETGWEWEQLGTRRQIREWQLYWAKLPIWPWPMRPLFGHCSAAVILLVWSMPSSTRTKGAKFTTKLQCVDNKGRLALYVEKQWQRAVQGSQWKQFTFLE